MLTEDALKDIVQGHLPEKRFTHTLGVVETARLLARRWSADETVVVYAAYLHDYAKIYKGDELLRQAKIHGLPIDEVYTAYPELLHAKLGEFLAAKDLGITDPRILSAIRHHCYGHASMNLEDKIVFVADYIEPGRHFEGVEAVREMAFQHLDKAVLSALSGTLQSVITRGLPIHLYSIELRNVLIQTLMEG